MKPRITLCMIVKNESHIIKECLESVYKHIDYWVVSDTGSTDGTQDIIKNFFEEKKIPHQEQLKFHSIFQQLKLNYELWNQSNENKLTFQPQLTGLFRRTL